MLPLFFKPSDVENKKRIDDARLVFIYANALTSIATIGCLAIACAPLSSFILATAVTALATNLILIAIFFRVGQEERVNEYYKKYAELHSIKHDISINISHGAALAYQVLNLQHIINALKSFGQLIGIDYTTSESSIATCK